MSSATFEFPNQLSPKHIQTLFLKLEHGAWYSTSDLIDLLRVSLGEVDGKKVAFMNITSWTLLGICEKRLNSKPTLYGLSTFGKSLQETYSTNQELFFEIIHFLFYSSWLRTNNLKQARFWLYPKICDYLWDVAPGMMDSYGLTSVLQQDAQESFPEINPKFAERSVRAVFPWLATLTPPFLEKKTSKSQFTSCKREYCSPQLFHLALDLVYKLRQLKYGTSMAIDEKEIKAICSICLLNEDRFWEMADRAKMMMRGVDIRKGQFGTSIALEMSPQWIDIPEMPDNSASLNIAEDEDYE